MMILDHWGITRWTLANKQKKICNEHKRQNKYITFENTYTYNPGIQWKKFTWHYEDGRFFLFWSIGEITVKWYSYVISTWYLLLVNVWRQFIGKSIVLVGNFLIYVHMWKAIWYTKMMDSKINLKVYQLEQTRQFVL